MKFNLSIDMLIRVIVYTLQFTVYTLQMATLFIQSYQFGNFYVRCNNFSEAYFHAAQLCYQPRSFYHVSCDFTNKSFHIIKDSPTFISVYNGIHLLAFLNTHSYQTVSLAKFVKDKRYLETVSHVKEMKRIDLEMRKYVALQINRLQATPFTDSSTSLSSISTCSDFSKYSDSHDCRYS